MARSGHPVGVQPSPPDFRCSVDAAQTHLGCLEITGSALPPLVEWWWQHFLNAQCVPSLFYSILYTLTQPSQQVQCRLFSYYLYFVEEETEAHHVTKITQREPGLEPALWPQSLCSAAVSRGSCPPCFPSLSICCTLGPTFCLSPCCLLPRPHQTGTQGLQLCCLDHPASCFLCVSD